MIITPEQLDLLKSKLEQDPYSFMFESAEIKNNKEIIEQLIPNNNEILKFCSKSICADKDLVWKAIEQDGANLKYASEELKNDRDLVVMAIEKHGYPIIDASSALKADRSIAIQVAKRYPLGIQHLSEELKNDKELVLLAYHSLQSTIYLKDAKISIGKDLTEEIGNCDPMKYLESIKLYNEFNDKIENKEIMVKNKLKI